MGMTIEDAIHDTEVMKEYLEHRSEPRSEGLEVLIDIAYKYQKIEDIYYHQTGRALEDSLRSVIEDGKID